MDSDNGVKQANTDRIYLAFSKCSSTLVFKSQSVMNALTGVTTEIE